MIQTDYDAKNTKADPSILVNFGFFCGNSLWLRRKPRSVYLSRKSLVFRIISDISASFLNRFQTHVRGGHFLTSSSQQPRLSTGRYTAMPRRNSMLLRVFFNLPSNSSIASTGGTPVSARRNMTTLLYSSGW
jgi:hypothetical protein